MDLSIVITNWNRAALLSDCLRSVEANTHGIAYEIIVVDNGSSDGSAEAVRRCFPRVRLLANRENLGFSRGSNQGLGESRGRFVALLNNDTVLRENAFAKLVSFLDAHPEAGAVGPRLLNPSGRVQESALTSFISVRSALLGGEWTSILTRRLFPGAAARSGMILHAGEQDRPCEVAWLVGACLVARRDVVDRVGPLDERIFMYGEDMEWCYRIRQAGYAIFFLPDATVEHLDHLPTKDSMERVAGQQMAHQIYFYRKHKGAGAAACLHAALFLGSAAKLPAFAVLALLGRGAGPGIQDRLEWKVRFHACALKYFLRRPFLGAQAGGPAAPHRT